MLTLYAIRHASTSWNERGLMQGRRDVPLSDGGRAEAATWRLRCVERLTWTASPLSRAIDTAHLMSGSKPRIDEALIEMHWGAWEGCTVPELQARYGDEFTRNEALGLDFRPLGGESPREVCARVRGWLSSLDGAGPLAVVTHYGVMRAMLALSTGWDMTAKPPVKMLRGAAQRFAVRDGNLELVEANLPLGRP